MRLKATTLLETIVASLIFLLVFGMAMEALVHIHKISNPDWSAMEQSFNEFRDSSVVMSDGLREYPWGTMRWVRKDTSEMEGIVEINVTATMKGGQKIEYRYLVDEKDEI
ncbi:MAG TPA: hypothetical protein DDX40_08925 [Rikenellaceae bacterium]|nr:hypothetical protein [Rikenellaceae bacterium]